MFGRQDEPIDAAAEFDAADQERIEGARGPATFGSQRRRMPAGAWAFIVAVLSLALIIGGVAIWKARSVRASAVEKEKRSEAVSNTLPKLVQVAATEAVQTPAPAAPPSEPVVSAAARPQPQSTTTAPAAPPPPTKAQLLAQRRLSSGLEIGTSEAAASTSAVLADSATARGLDGELQRSLQPLRLTGATAGVLGDRNYLLTQGAMIDCQLETRIVTTQSGMTLCHVTRDVWSTNSQVTLIPRNSKIVGHYQGGIKQGQARIFILWTRIETPDGVIVALDSPGTGPLGEAGVGGIVDNHFFERFGVAVLVSLIGDVGQVVAGQGQGNSGNSIQFGGTTQGAEQASVEILKSTINIAPTLYKNQGDRVAIFVARDLDFSGVYALRSE